MIGRRAGLVRVSKPYDQLVDRCLRERVVRTRGFLNVAPLSRTAGELVSVHKANYKHDWSEQDFLIVLKRSASKISEGRKHSLYQLQ